MIRSLTVKNPAKALESHWPQCKGLPQSGVLEFHPRVNILWGDNGTGKSTLLREIARQTYCEEGGVQKVTGDAIRKNWDDSITRRKGYVEKGIDLDHDGGPFLFFDPGAQVGIIGGAFNDDFFDEGLINTMAKGSAGETTARRGSTVFSVIFRQTPIPPLAWGAHTQKEDCQHIIKALAGRPIPNEALIPTILIDEGERSLALARQHGFWNNLMVRAMSTKLPPIQLIIATHSPFALGWPVNYIDTVPGSREKTETLLRSFFTAERKLRL